jgi:hypothetical protein
MCLVLLYFMDCMNLNCSNPIYNNHLRCGKCRQYKRYECCSCGTEVSTAIKRSCEDCHIFRSQLLRYKYRANFCLRCDSQMNFKYGSKWCSPSCKNWAISRSTKKVTNCMVCDKDLIMTGKHRYCSDECYSVYRKIYLRARSRKCHV